MTGVCYIEEAELQTLEQCSVLPSKISRGFAEADQVGLIVGLQIVRNSRNVELPQDLGLVRVLQTDDEQRVHSLKSNQVCSVAHEPGSVERFTRRQSFESSDNVQATVQNVQVRLLLATRPYGSCRGYLTEAIASCSDAEVAVVLIHGELVQNVARDSARRLIADACAVNGNAVHSSLFDLTPD